MKMKLIQKTELIYELKMGYVQSFLIDDGEDLVLIDTGTSGLGEQILKAIDLAGLDSSRLNHIIITHLHNDHTGSLAELKKLTGAKIYAHEMEAQAIEEGVLMRPSKAHPQFPYNIIVPLLLGKSINSKQEGTPVDIRLKGGETLEPAGGIRIIWTPGHTAGHICCLVEKEKMLIAGDAARGGKKPSYPFLYEDMPEAMKSLEKIKTLDFEKVYFGHGCEITKDSFSSIRNNPF